MRLFIRVVAVSIVCLGVSLAAAQTGGLRVQVLSASDRGPLPGATVTLSNSQGRVATTAELTDESSVVELMANAHRAAARPSTRSTSMTSMSRRTRVATLIAAGVIGFGGVAAASPGGFDVLSVGADEVEEVATTVSTTIVEEVTTTTTAEDPDEEVETQRRVEEESSEEEDAKVEQVEVEVIEGVPDERDMSDARFDEDDCVTDEEGNELNHGKTVSAVARGDVGFEEFEVRDAAHSDCGKIDRDTDGTDTAEDREIEESEESEEATQEAQASPEKSKPDHAKSKGAKADSNAKSNGNAKANGNAKKSND
jgi:hypothetical protein